jgi:hypothetical protein
MIELFRGKNWLTGERLVHKEQPALDNQFDLSSIEIVDGWYRLKIYRLADYGSPRCRPLATSQLFRIQRGKNIFSKLKKN